MVMLTNAGANVLSRQPQVGLRVVGEYDDRGLRQGFAKMNVEAQKHAKTMNKSIASTIGQYALMAVSVTAVTTALKYMIDTANTQLEAEHKRNQALKQQGTLTAQLVQELNAQASALQQVSTTGDEVLIQQQALLVAYGMTADEIQKTTQVALDFASGTGRDLASAIQLLTKAYKGNTGELSRYGIILDTTIPKSEKFNAVLTEMTKMFGGSAEAERDTLSGAIKVLGNTFGDFVETLVVPAVPALVSFIQKAEKAVQLQQKLNSKVSFTDVGLMLMTGGTLGAPNLAKKVFNKKEKHKQTSGNFGYDIVAPNTYKASFEPVLVEIQESLLTKVEKAFLTGSSKGLFQGIAESKDVYAMLNQNIYDATKTALIQSLIDGVIKERALEPLIEAIKNIAINQDTGLVSGLDQVLIKTQDARAEIELLAPVIQTVTSELSDFKQSLFETAVVEQSVAEKGVESFNRVKNAVQATRETVQATAGDMVQINNVLGSINNTSSAFVSSGRETYRTSANNQIVGYVDSRGNYHRGTGYVRNNSPLAGRGNSLEGYSNPLGGVY